jgi:hypothetical protein
VIASYIDSEEGKKGEKERFGKRSGSLGMELDTNHIPLGSLDTSWP